MFRILKSVVLAVVRSDAVSAIVTESSITVAILGVIWGFVHIADGGAQNVVASGVRSGDRNGPVEHHVVRASDLFESTDGICVFATGTAAAVETVVIERCSVVRR